MSQPNTLFIPDVEQVLDIVCNEFNITRQQIQSPAVKSGNIVFFAKAVATYLLRKEYGIATNRETMALLGYKAKTFTPIKHNIRAVVNAGLTNDEYIVKALTSIKKKVQGLKPYIPSQWGGFRTVLEQKTPAA